MALVGRQFGLASAPGSGVFCGVDGLVVGDTPLLEKTLGNGRLEWHVRSLTDLNRDLSESYGLPVELDQKVLGLSAVAAALTRGDIMHAQIATLHLQFPDPPALAKADLDLTQAVALAHKLEAAGLRAGRLRVRTALAADSRQQMGQAAETASPAISRRSQFHSRKPYRFRAGFKSRLKSCRHR